MIHLIKQLGGKLLFKKGRMLGFQYQEVANGLFCSLVCESVSLVGPAASSFRLACLLLIPEWREVRSIEYL
jgi:hypothetical protein